MSALFVSRENGARFVSRDASLASERVDVLASILYQGVETPFETTGVGVDGDDLSVVTFGGIACVMSQSLGDGILTVTPWEEDLYQPLNHNTPYPVVFSDGTKSATANRLYGVPAGLEHRTIPGSISTADNSLYKHPLLQPRRDVYIPSLGGGTVDEDGTLRDVPFGTYEGGWMRGLDYIMHSFSIEVSETGGESVTPIRYLSGNLLRGKLL